MPPPPYVIALGTAPSISVDINGYRTIDGELVVYNAGFEYLFTSGEENRYNTFSVFALYTATSSKTAQVEFEHSLRGAGLDPSLVDQYQFPIRLRLMRVLDLTNEAIRHHLGVTLPQLLATWEDKDGNALTQILGTAVNEGVGNFSAIQYPSAADPGGVCLVVFRKRMGLADLVRPQSSKAKKQWP